MADKTMHYLIGIVLGFVMFIFAWPCWVFYGQNNTLNTIVFHFNIAYALSVIVLLVYFVQMMQ